MAGSGEASKARGRDPLGVPGTERLLTLTDGVVAIALTLLVLQLEVPSLPAGKSPDSAPALFHALTNVSFSSQFTAYVVSFYVIAQFWLAHHRVFRMVRGHSESLAWWNFLFLFTITLFPFSSDLLGKYPDNPLAVIEFSVNLLLASLSTTLVITLARHQGLLVHQADRVLTRGLRARGAASAGVIVLSIVVAFFSTSMAKYAWLLLIVAPWIARRAARTASEPEPERAADAAEAGTDPDSGTAG
ncbi:MAG: TMEM175 family protein [Acidimicrobiales bacterium]|jgi:uncharacterized membrane protein